MPAARTRHSIGLVDDAAVLDRAAADLAAAYPGSYSVHSVRRLLDDSHDRLASTARISTHLPVLSIRFARERLAALARAEGHLVTTTPEVLFVCVHNAGRSQMAAALLDRHAAGRVHVRSAGSAPTGEINPAVVQVMAELGLDLSKEFPKPLTDDVVRAADVVITMGCGDACPIYPGKRYLDWELTDPAGRPVEQVRQIREEIDRRVRTLLDELPVAPADA
ncbi:MAG: arsenate reductase ArsC [Mycobacteriales bacterium]